MKLNKFLSIAALLSCLVVTSCGPKQQPNEGGNNDQGNGSETEGNGGNEGNEGNEGDGGQTTPPNPDTASYYKGITGNESGVALRDALNRIISVRNPNHYDYSDLTNNSERIYEKTDLKDNGYIRDIYSNTTKYRFEDSGGSASAEGVNYNKEHTIPKSWWGGSKGNQGCDPFIVFPSDSKCNSMRAAMPFGEVTKKEWSSNGGYCLQGKGNINGSSHSVFEPADEVKGDMARVYFYAVTCYNTSGWTTGDGNYVFSASGTVGLTKYARDLFVKWNKLDPVDEWERKRNDRVYNLYKNRNPFVDNNEWVAKIWGN